LRVEGFGFGVSLEDADERMGEGRAVLRHERALRVHLPGHRKVSSHSSDLEVDRQDRAELEVDRQTRQDKTRQGRDESAAGIVRGRWHIRVWRVGAEDTMRGGRAGQLWGEVGGWLRTGAVNMERNETGVSERRKWGMRARSTSVEGFPATQTVSTRVPTIRAHPRPFSCRATRRPTPDALGGV
jgi:hypothetical protein